MPYYARTHFYEREAEMKLKESKSDAGLCSNCTKNNIFPLLKPARPFCPRLCSENAPPPTQLARASPACV